MQNGGNSYEGMPCTFETGLRRVDGYAFRIIYGFIGCWPQMAVHALAVRFPAVSRGFKNPLKAHKPGMVKQRVKYR